MGREEWETTERRRHFEVLGTKLGRGVGGGKIVVLSKKCLDKGEKRKTDRTPEGGWAYNGANGGKKKSLAVANGGKEKVIL